MGKAMKVALPIAAIAGIGLATSGFGLAGAGAGLGAAGGPGTALGASGGGFFGGLGSLFSSKGASMAMSGLSGLTSLVGGIQQGSDARFDAAMERRKMEMAELAAKQEEANLRDEKRAATAAAIAQAAAQGWAPKESRTMMAFVNAQNEEFDSRITNIRARAAAGTSMSGIRINQYKSKARTSQVAGVLGAGRDLMGAAKRWNT